MDEAGPVQNPLSQFFSKNREIWGGLIQAVAWGVGLSSGFIIAPPAEDFVSSTYKLACFICAFVVGLFFIASRHFTRKRTATWLWITIVALLIAILVGLVYVKCFNNWTRVYYGHRKVIGSHLLPSVETARKAFEEQAHRSIDIDDVPKYMSSDPKKCFVAGEIDTRELWLLIWYVAAEAGFLFAALSMIQAITSENGAKSGAHAG